MNNFTTKPISLPAAEALSKRSRNFYDRTYKWDSDGFIDDVGGRRNPQKHPSDKWLTHPVYRKFDCYDPHARAPTPSPTMSMSDKQRDADAQPSADHVLPESKAGAETETFAFASDAKSRGGTVIVRHDALFRGRVDRDYLIDKMESVLIASQANKVRLTMEQCYQLCGIPHLNTRVDTCLPKNITPPTSPLAKQGTLPAAEIHKTCPVTPGKSLGFKVWSPASSSGLSDCPSDLSEWDVGSPPGFTVAAARS